MPEVYAYDHLPEPLRVQMTMLIRDALGSMRTGGQHSSCYPYYKTIVEILRREYGMYSLAEHGNGESDFETELRQFVLKATFAERVLDAMELAMRIAEERARSGHTLPPLSVVEQSIQELNVRFQEHGVGYRYESGKIVRIDSDLLHADAVKPALTLLHMDGYEGPLKEFMTAHEHYRHSRHEDAIVNALKAFESTMKAICDRKGWPYNEGDTATKLINACLSKGLVDGFWLSHFTGLRSMLESGVPTARNKSGGHGQGAQVRDVPQELAGFVMHQTAAVIVFLIRSAESS